MTKIHSNDKHNSVHQSDNFPQPKASKQRQQSIFEFINQGDLMFDVGANIGSKTDMFLSKGARIVCFEPQPECAKILQQKYGDNQNVIIVKKGLAEKPGNLSLSICTAANVISTFSDKWKTGRFANYNWNKVVTVEVTCLDEMIKTYGLPKYCKIDVEGFEYQVLKGLSRAIPFISFEFSFEFSNEAKKCISHLEKLGYKDFNFAKAETQKLVFGDWISSGTLFQYLINLNDELLWGDIYAKYSMESDDIESKSKPKMISLTDDKSSRIGDSLKESSSFKATGESSVLSYLVKSKLISSNGLIFDIGANVGEWTKRLLELRRDFDVHLFEPVPHTYHSLLKNLAEHTKTGNLFFNNCAITRKEELRSFYYYEDSPSWSTFYRRYQVEKDYNLVPPKIFQVYTTTLDKYCKRLNINRISFLKIDVEGAELDALHGAKGLLRQGIIDFIQFEYGGTFKDAGIKLQQIFELLSEFGYLIFKILSDSLEYKPQFFPSFEDFNYSNFLAVNKRLRTIFLKESPKMLDLKQVFEEHSIGPRGIIHIGAHEGREIEKYLEMGVEKVLFIEANPKVFERLKKKIAGIPNVQAANCAISNKCGSVTLHVTSMDQSSSILPLKHHKELYPDIKETHQVTVRSTTLDVLLKESKLSPFEFNVLNIDIQGAELLALQGALDTLKYIDAINTEINYEELYEGCALINQLDEFLSKHGFDRVATTTPYHTSWGDALYVKKPVITMSSLGKNGRFANQLFQYAFLKIYAKEHNLRVETPGWIGKYLFGHNDSLISKQLPVVQQKIYKLSEDHIPNAKKPFKDVDFWGYFQYHTSYYAPYKDYFRSLFWPIPDIEAKLKHAYSALQSMGKTIVGLHLRRADYGYAYYFVTPSEWYKDWLNGFWDTLDNPVLFIASDEPNKVIGDFAEYNPVTSKDLGIELPGADFYPDFYLLSQCNVLAISNSSYSFAAAMLNERAKFFFRPHLPTKKLVPFDPWNSETIFRNARVEDYRQTEIFVPDPSHLLQVTGEQVAPQKPHLFDKEQLKVAKHDVQYPQTKVLLFFLSVREAYRQVIFSTREVFCGPDCKSTVDGDRCRTIRTPVGAYDVKLIMERRLPSTQTPDLVVVKADATGRNYPINLKSLKCPKLLILGNTQHLKTPIQSLLKYALQENFDFIMTDHKRHHLHYFKEAGFEKVFWLPGFNIYPHKQPYYENKTYEISFVGQAGRWHPYRKYVLQYLTANGIKINQFQTPQDRAAEIYAQSLINLNISLNGDLNLRVFEVLSSGGFLLTDRLSKESGLDIIFKDGEHLVCFNDEKDLLDKIQYFLKNPDEARAIARNGYEEFKRNHTPEKKIKELMDVIFHGKQNPLYDIQKEKRSVYVKSDSSTELMPRVATYEFFQEMHLKEKAPAILFWPGVDGKLACDVIDLPRLQLCIKNDSNEIPEENLRLFRNTGASEQIKFITMEELRKVNGTWNVAALTASELLSTGLENILYSLDLKWLVVTDGLGLLNQDQTLKLKEALTVYGFEKPSEEIEAYYWKDKSLYGEILFSENRIAEAVRCFKLVLLEEPSHINALNNLGVISYQLGKLDAADKFLFKAISLNRRDLNALINLSHVYLKMERFNDASKLFQEAALLDSDNPSLWFHLGFCYEQLNRNSEALEAYKRCGNLNNNEWPVGEQIESLKKQMPVKSSKGIAKQILAPKRILVINNLYPPQELGGYGRVICDFANILKKRGHSIYVLTSDSPYLGEIEQNEHDVDRSLILFGGWHNGVCKSIDNKEQIIRIIKKNHQKLQHVIRNISPDLCLLGNIDFLSHRIIQPLLENKMPVIHHIGSHNPGYSVQEAPQNDFYHLSAASQWVKEKIIQQGYRLGKISVVYPGALVNEFKMSVPPAVDKLRIAYASIVLPYKGPHILINALKKLHDAGIDFSCSLAGTTTDESFANKLKNFVIAAGMEEKVHFTGFLQREELKKKFARHNVLVFPSIINEAFGISQVEAMAAGLMVVTSATGGACEIIEHGISGVIFKSGDDASLAQELLQLSQNINRWQQIAVAGQERAMKYFDIEQSVDIMEETYCSLLKFFRSHSSGGRD